MKLFFERTKGVGYMVFGEIFRVYRDIWDFGGFLFIFLFWGYMWLGRVGVGVGVAP